MSPSIQSLARGQRVTVPTVSAPGWRVAATIASVTYAPPDFLIPRSVTVVRDDRRADPSYSGSVYRARDVDQILCARCGLGVAVIGTEQDARCEQCQKNEEPGKNAYIDMLISGGER